MGILQNPKVRTKIEKEASAKNEEKHTTIERKFPNRAGPTNLKVVINLNLPSISVDRLQPYRWVQLGQTRAGMVHFRPVQWDVDIDRMSDNPSRASSSSSTSSRLLVLVLVVVVVVADTGDRLVISETLAKLRLVYVGTLR